MKGRKRRRPGTRWERKKIVNTGLHLLK